MKVENLLKGLDDSLALDYLSRATYSPLSDIRSTEPLVIRPVDSTPGVQQNLQAQITTGGPLGSDTFGGVKPHVAKAGNLIRQRFGVKDIGGVSDRGHKSEHPLGLALDVMTYDNLSLGDQIADWAQNNAKSLGIMYIIWRQQINSMRKPGWRRMENRGSVTDNHFDHVHISFTASGIGESLTPATFTKYNPPRAN